MIIEYDDVLKKWVVWLIKGSTMGMLFSSKNKKDCEKFIKRVKKVGSKDGKRTFKIKNTKKV